MKKRAKPVLLAMIVSDKIVHEQETKKISLIGLFSTIHAESFPCVHSRMHIYAALTDYVGSAKCEIRFSDETGKRIADLPPQYLNFPEKLAIVEITFAINNLPLPKEGIYHFDLFIDGQPVGHRKFVVQKSNR